MPTYRPNNCAIDLPGTAPPEGRLYSLLEPERQAMEEYINNSLMARILLTSGFFFVEKKGKTLRLCKNY